MKHPARTILILLTLLTPLPGMTQTLLSSEIIRFGGRFEERAQGMDVDAGGNIFITGHTMSDNLPCVGTLNPNHHNPMASHQYDQWLHSDGYVAKLGPDGATVLWCTYLGGTDQDRAYNLKVDATGIYVAGITDSDDFDGSGGQITSGHAVFITKLSLDGTQVLFTTLIDGPGNEWMRNAMALSGGSLYVSGFTESDNLQGHPSLGGRDGFVARLDTGTGQIQALRRVGGSDNDTAWSGVVVDQEGAVFVAGHSESSDLVSSSLPAGLAATMHQPLFGGYDPGAGDWAGDAFIIKLSADLSQIQAATYFGGSRGENASVNHGLALDPLGRPVLIVDTRSTDLALPGPGWDKFRHLPPQDLAGQDLTSGPAYEDGLYDAVAAVFSTDLRAVLASTLVGGHRVEESSGVAVAPDGRVWLTGNTNSTDLGVTSDAIAGTYTPPVGPPQYPWFFDPEFGPDMILAAFSPDLGHLEFGSYIGGDGNLLTGDAGRMIVSPADQPGRIYLSGVTDTPLASTAPFPATILHTTPGEGTDAADAVVAILNVSLRQNIAPQAFTDDDQVYNVDSVPYTAHLAGSVADSDGLPQARWSVVEQPSGAPAPVFSSPDQATTEVLLAAAGTYVFRLTADDGVDQATDTVTIQLRTTTQAGGLPRRATLGQNHPNPFNPRTTIHYHLPEAAMARLTIHDLAGRHVRTLVADSPQPAGGHEVLWDGLDDGGQEAPSGVYFYRLETRDQTLTRRMSLVR